MTDMTDMTDTPDSYAVTLFEPGGAGLTIPCDDNQEARTFADTFRPLHGASYVHDEARELVFKPYKQTGFSRSELLRHGPTGTRRHGPAQIEAAAKRFENDGEHKNAAQMRELLT